MKTKLFLMAFFAILALEVRAESDYDYSSLLNRALEMIEAGNCESAQKFYNTYTKLSGQSEPSVQTLIEDCLQNTEKVYKINDKIHINSLIYKVVYTEDKGKHGFAVCDFGSGPITEDMISERKLPTRSEMILIYKNRRKIHLVDGVYWTIDRVTSSRNYCLSFYNINHEWRTNEKVNSCGILLIYRF